MEANRPGSTNVGDCVEGDGGDDPLLADVVAGMTSGVELPLGSAFEYAPTGMALLDVDGRFKVVNPAFSRLLGRNAEDIVGRTPTELTHPDDAAASAEVRDSMVAGEAVAHHIEKRYLRPDGTPVHALRTTTALRDRHGALIGFFTQAVDMTDTVRYQEALRRSDRRHRALVRHAAEMILLLDGDGMITYASPAGERLMGYPPDVLEGTRGFRWVHPDEAPRMEALLDRHRATPGVSSPIELRVRHADGSWRHTEVVVSNLLDDPEMRALVVNVRDVTERHVAASHLQRWAAQQAAIASLGATALRGTAFVALADRAVRTVAEALGVEWASIVRAEPDGQLSVVSWYGPALSKGLDPARRDGRPSSLAALAIATREPALHPAEPPDPAAETAPARRAPEPERGAAVPVRGPQSAYGALTAHGSSPGRFGPGDITFLQGVANIVAGSFERQQAQEELRHRAMHDGLTGLPNREQFATRLSEALEMGGRRPVSLLLVDIDNFKVVNDSLGHAAGDSVVRAVAGRISAAVADRGSVARLGGDEFLVLCPGSDCVTAVRVAERIRRAMVDPVSCCGREVVVTVSTGITVAAGHSHGVDDLLAQADIAMYAAKRAGKDRAAVFDRSMRAQVTERLDMTSNLRRAVTNRELLVHFQPIVHTGSGLLFGAEALLRWEHPVDGLLHPGRFIGFAEDSGLIVPIGLWVLDVACRQAVAWRQARRPAMVSVNVSPRQLAEPSILESVAGVLEATGVEPGQITLEVTENAVMSDLDRSRTVIQGLRELGVRVGLDDFGTGHSSLSHLAELPLDFVKIDQSFIARISDDRRAAALLGTIGRLCDDLDLHAVAEGVETQDQLERVRAIGIAYSQGYLFGRAVSPTAFPEALRAERSAPARRGTR